jgi:hypothetical protein
MPIEQDILKREGTTIPNYARQVWIMPDVTAQQLEARLQRWNDIAPRQPEPLMNLALMSMAAGPVALLFPRSKHRPDVFFTGEFTVSPATIDLCGMFVTPVESDFNRITGDDIRRIYQEVTISDNLFQELTQP